MGKNKLKSTWFDTSEELCEFVNKKNVTIVWIEHNSKSLDWILFYQEEEG